MRTGLDLRSSAVYGATVNAGSGRFTIEWLIQPDDFGPEALELIAEGELTLSIPNRLAIVKSVAIEPTDLPTPEDRIFFELAQSVLESEKSFLFLSQATGVDGRYLGTILRREHLPLICKAYDLNCERKADQPGFQLRSIALGKGYLAFCHQEEGELTCLVDLAGDDVSICFIQGGQIAEVGSLKNPGHDLTTPAGQEQLAIDLKTVVNFKQATLLDLGISIPLSSLLFFGEAVDDSFRKTVETYFPSGVSQPRFHDGLLKAGETIEPEAMPLFLVALGMAVN